MTSPLAGARAKLRRANDHLAELDSLGKLWAARVSYELRLEVVDRRVLVARMFNLANAEPPLQMAMVAGDAVHNLRSALDHVIFQFAVAGGASGEQSEYPIFEDAVEYERRSKDRLAGVSQELRDKITTTQPFHLRDGVSWRKPSGPDDPLAINAALRVIRRLDNRDKHRLALSATAGSPHRQPTFRGVRTAEGTFPLGPIGLQDGAELFRVKALEPIHDMAAIQVGFRPTFLAIFGEEAAGRAEAELVRASVGDLHEVARLVGLLVESFAEASDIAPPPVGPDDLTPSPGMVIPWQRPGGEAAKVGVFVDLGIRRRRILDIWPEVITAIEGARSVGEMWTRLDEAGVAAKFAVKTMDAEAATEGIDIAVELEDRSGQKDIWIAAIQPMPAGAGVSRDPARKHDPPIRKAPARQEALGVIPRDVVDE